MKEIPIIGAGPAGLTSAIVLARNGFKVKVYEKSYEVGHRLNGDFQGLENWSSEKDALDILKEIGIGIDFICEPYYGGAVFAPAMEPATVKSERPIFYLVKRGSMEGTLDRGLKEQALAAGAEIVFNTKIENLDGRAIVATGPKFVTAVAVGITFETAMEDRAVVTFGDDISPKGYTYLLINKGRGTLATVLFGDFKRGNECFEGMLRFFRKNLDMDIKNEKRFSSYGNFFMKDSQVIDGKLYTGESAGFQDNLWGFGMKYAIISGHLAAKSIIEGLDYDKLWKAELKTTLEASLVNRYLIEKFGDIAYRYLTKKFACGNPCGFLKKQYNYSFFKNLFLPLAHRKHNKLLNRSCH
jgi:flavin-dependent dehydrogenase